MWRVVEFRTGGGATARKDPIWDLLKQREDANSLLHEGALYVLGKSLRIENETLFQFMQRLRSTRNKIVHRGEPPDAADNKYLSIDMFQFFGCPQLHQRSAEMVGNWAGLQTTREGLCENLANTTEEEPINQNGASHLP